MWGELGGKAAQVYLEEIAGIMARVSNSGIHFQRDCRRKVSY